MKKKLITVFFLFIIITSSFADNIRGEVKNIIIIKSEKVAADFKLYDLTGVSVMENPFLEGLELTLTIPEDLAKYRDSFMLNIYYRLDSIPKESLKTYKGDLLLSTVIPVYRKMFISLPMTEHVNMDMIPGSILSDAVNQSETPLLLSINPAMKGIPRNVLNSSFNLEVIPILSNKGILNLNIIGSSPEAAYTIFLDGKKIRPKADFILEEGIHQIKVESDKYKEISRSFVINRSESTKIDLELEAILPMVLFEAPIGAKIILDGKKLNSEPGKSIQIRPGEHVVRMEIGDYFLSKKFTVMPDKNYKISLFLDILVKDN